MRRTFALVCTCFCAGLLAAIIRSLLAWLSTEYGLAELAGVHLHYSFHLALLYPKMVIGGLWGIAFAITVVPSRSRRLWARKGMLVSLAPTLYELFVVFPYQTEHGPLGIELGLMTPLFVFLFNLAWGFFTGILARLLWGKS